MRLPLSILFLCATVFAGCNKSGADVAPVSGQVKLDGKPLEFANVTFQPEGKQPGMGRTDKDGHYELIYKRGIMGAPVGENTVRIMLDTELARHPDNIPARYNTQSELKREVKPGKNEIDFDLTTEAKK